MKKTGNKIYQILMIFSLMGAITSCTLVRIIIYNYDDINDYRKFPSREHEDDSIKFIFQTTEKRKYR